MDQVSLVDRQIDDGKRLVDGLVRFGVEVTGAGWVQPSENEQWYLYLVSPLVDKEGAPGAYRRIHPVLQQMSEPFWVEPFQVKLIGPSHPIAVGILEIQRRYPAAIPTRYGGVLLGGLSIDGAYVYPTRTNVSHA